MIREKGDLSSDKNELIGCLDLGSSYFRLLISPGGGTETGSGREPCLEKATFVGWGEDVVRYGFVRESTLRRAVKTLSEILGCSAAAGCPEPVIVGTGTFRSAANRNEISSRMENVAPGPVNILSAVGEAAYSFLGATSGLPGWERAALIDMGGTSTEVSAGRAGSLEKFTGIRLGTHNLAMGSRHFGGRMTYRALRKRLIESEEAARFAVLADKYSPPEYVYVTGGTAVTLGMIYGHAAGMKPGPYTDTRMSYSSIQLLMRRLRQLASLRAVRILPLPQRRASLLPAGIVLLNFILESLNIDMFTITARDLRRGIILSGGEIAGRYIFDEQKSSYSR